MEFKVWRQVLCGLLHPSQKQQPPDFPINITPAAQYLLRQIKVEEEPRIVNLVRLPLRAFLPDFKELEKASVFGGGTADLYRRIFEMGFDLCPLETAARLSREEWWEDPSRDFIHIASRPLVHNQHPSIFRMYGGPKDGTTLSAMDIWPPVNVYWNGDWVVVLPDQPVAPPTNPADILLELVVDAFKTEVKYKHFQGAKAESVGAKLTLL